MTAEEMEERLIELEDEIYELGKQMDEERFCDDCEHIYIYQDTEEYWGRKVIREVPCCDADFCPRYSDCPRNEEYRDLEDKREEPEKEYERLSALYDLATEKEEV